MRTRLGILGILVTLVTLGAAGTAAARECDGEASDSYGTVGYGGAPYVDPMGDRREHERERYERFRERRARREAWRRHRFWRW
jgi:hypothetical protein